MRVGLISDLHGNLPALEAVLDRLERDSIDRYVCLGDVAVGPWASETVERLSELGPALVLGNWDAWMLDGVPPFEPSPVGEMLLEMGQFWSDQLDGDARAYMRGAQPEVELEIGSGRVLFLHGSARSNTEPIFATTPSDELAEMIGGDTAPAVVAVGHTHVQMVRRLPDTLVVNPGSVGLPFLEWPVGPARVCPWAEYGVLDWDGVDDLTVELRRAPYDVESLIRHTHESGVPHAEWWTACFQLD